MKATMTLLAVIGLLGLTLSSSLMAQSGMAMKGSGGWGAGSAYGRMYDLQNIETLSGEVITVERITPMRAMNQGVHLTVKTTTETVSVHLGPAWYIENQDISIAAKDQVEIKGSRITFNGEAAMIAAEVKKDNDILQLRDAKGFPVWSGWRRR